MGMEGSRMTPAMIMTIRSLADQLEQALIFHGPRIIPGFQYNPEIHTKLAAINSVIAIMRGVKGECSDEEWQGYIARTYLPGYIPDHLLDQSHPMSIKISCKLEECVIDPIWLCCVNLLKGSVGKIGRTTPGNSRHRWVDTSVGLPVQDSITGSQWSYSRMDIEDPIMDDSALDSGKYTMAELVLLLEARAAKEAKARYSKITGLIKHGLDPTLVYTTPKASADRISFFNQNPVKAPGVRTEEREFKRLAYDDGFKTIMGPILPNQGIPTDVDEVAKFIDRYPNYKIITAIQTHVKIEG